MGDMLWNLEYALQLQEDGIDVFNGFSHGETSVNVSEGMNKYLGTRSILQL